MLNSASDDEHKVIGNTIFIYLPSFSRFTGARRCVRREQWHVMSIEFAYDDEKRDRERERNGTFLETIMELWTVLKHILSKNSRKISGNAKMLKYVI